VATTPLGTETFGVSQKLKGSLAEQMNEARNQKKRMMRFNHSQAEVTQRKREVKDGGGES